MIKTNKIDDGHANLFQMHSTNKKKEKHDGGPTSGGFSDFHRDL